MSVLWLHINKSSPNIMEYLRGCKPPGVLLQDPDVPYVHQVRDAIGSRAFIMCKHRFGPGQQDVTKPEWAYAQFRDRAIALNGVADCWKTYNEESTSSVDQLRQLAAFDIAMMRLANADGVKLAIMNASVGTPERPDVDGGAQWKAYLPAIEAAIQGGHFVCVHEYGAANIRQECQPGRRWRPGRIIEVLRLMPELKRARWIIGEVGIDGQSIGKRQENAGWRHADAGFTAAHYLHEELAAIDDLYMQQQPEILGAAIFCMNGSTDGWQSFEIVPEVTELLPTYFDTKGRVYPAKGGTVTPPQPPDKLADMLKTEFGTQYEDWRVRLPDKASVTNSKGETWRYGPRALSIIEYLAIHHSGPPTTAQTSPQSMYDYHLSDKAKEVKDANGHVIGIETDPWPGIGYHFLAYPDRVCYVGDIATSRANVTKQNPWVVGICLVGDFTNQPPPDSQIVFGQRLVAVLRAFLGRPVPIKAHRNFPNLQTSCPGNAWPDAAVATLDKQYHFVWGFSDYAALHPDSVGKPTENEWYCIDPMGANLSIQRTTRGVLVYSLSTGVQFAKWT